MVTLKVDIMWLMFVSVTNGITAMIHRWHLLQKQMLKVLFWIVKVLIFYFMSEKTNRIKQSAPGRSVITAHKELKEKLLNYVYRLNDWDKEFDWFS